MNSRQFHAAKSVAPFVRLSIALARHDSSHGSLVPRTDGVRFSDDRRLH